jgi:flagellar motility protein MotE (MotC chaperone)
VSAVFEWHQRGDSLVVEALPGALVRVGVETDQRQGSLVELPLAAVLELRRALLEVVDDPDLANAQEALDATEQQLGEAERDRDAAVERAKRAEAHARELLEQLEAAKTALGLADQRARALEVEPSPFGVDPAHSAARMTPMRHEVQR